jgi:multidrug resistance efflux pump
MFNRARRTIRFFLTLLLLAFAGFAIVGLWTHYMVSPWTRDGQVRVQVADIVPQVSGQIVNLLVQDNQYVHKGELLYVIDQGDYKVAQELSEADVASKLADLEVKRIGLRGTSRRRSLAAFKSATLPKLNLWDSRES